MIEQSVTHVDVTHERQQDGAVILNFATKTGAYQLVAYRLSISEAQELVHQINKSLVAARGITE